jgi:hypothetical protein
MKSLRVALPRRVCGQLLLVERIFDNQTVEVTVVHRLNVDSRQAESASLQVASRNLRVGICILQVE